MKRLSIIIVLILALFMGGCATNFEPYVPERVNFEETEAYVLDLSRIEKPTKPQGIYLDKDMLPTPPENAVYFAFSAEEFKKIMALSELFNSQQDLLKEHETLVNTHIAQINALKELIAIKDAKVEAYIQLWANSENAYRQERAEHMRDGIVNKITEAILFGGLILLIL
jgi:PBP1b-binding outer membrane lipoprotein LpoB